MREGKLIIRAANRVEFAIDKITHQESYPLFCARFLKAADIGGAAMKQLRKAALELVEAAGT